MPSPSSSLNPSLYADVVVPRHINRTFTYAVPPALRPAIRTGSLVQVPFGSSLLQAVVVGLAAAPPRGAMARSIRHFRDVAAVLDASGSDGLTPELLDLTRQIADYYLAPWGQCLRLVVPPATKPARRAKPGRSHGAIPATPPESLPPELPDVPAAWRPSLETPADGTPPPASLIVAPLAHRLAGYLLAAGRALVQGRSALIVSPDTARAALMARRARQEWPEQVALFHSGLSPAARAEAWREMQSGRLRIVVGTRSAVFAPLPSLGLICVDQEDDASLKEEQEPHYHARDVARMRAAQHQARLILGSSHPSLETWQDCGSRALTWHPPAPDIQVVDMRRQPYGTLLSMDMVDGIRAALDAGSRAVLFLNRKGFSPALLCRDCGQALRCPDCTVALTYFRKAANLACRYCGLALPLPDVCPACQAARLEPVGSGTERLEDVLRRQFPGAVITRLDRERARTPAKAEALRQEAAAGRWDLLIGTRMLFQGSPLPPVGFVGIPQADDGLHVADFRAAEHAYHALRDAADLALPAASGGRVIMQSHMPDHHAVAAMTGGRPALFYEQELIFRQALGYPPAAHLISLRVSGKEAGRVQQAAKRWARLLLAAIAAGGPGRHAQTTVLGPVPAGHAQLRGRHRWQLLVKAGQADAGREAVKTTLDKLESAHKNGLKFEVDVDPVEML